MVLLQEGIKQKSALSEGNQQDEKANVPSNDRKELRGAELLRFDIQVIVSSTVLAINLLGPNNLGCDTVSMMLFVFAVARFNILSINSQEFKILPFVIKIFFETLQKWRKESFWQSLDHIIGIDNKDWPWALAEIADALLLVLL